jgi:hypothetical protein
MRNGDSANLRRRASACLRLAAALGLLAVATGCVVVPAYGPPPYYYHHYHEWHDWR